MFDRKALKAEARRRLKESQPRYWKVMLIWALVAVLLPNVVNSLGGNSMSEFYVMAMNGIDISMLMSAMRTSVLVAMFLSIVITLYQIVMNFGVTNYSLKLWRGEACDAKSLFDGFAMVWRVIGTQFMTGMIVVLWALFFALPLTMVITLAMLLDSTGLGIFVMVLGYLAYVVVLVVISLNFTLAQLALADQPELGVMGAIHRSRELMRGHKGEYFLLNLSFIGWIVLSFAPSMTLATLGATGILTLPEMVNVILIVVLMLPTYVWLEPYMQVSYAGFYDALCPKQPEAEPLNEYPEF